MASSSYLGPLQRPLSPLSESQWRILSLVRRHPGLETRDIWSHPCLSLQSDFGNVYETLRRLQRRGLVRSIKARRSKANVRRWYSS
jgi:DNA-binding MarR family transcriptional regulator